MHNNPEFRALAVKMARKLLPKIEESLGKVESLEKDKILKYEESPAYFIQELSGLSQYL